MSINPKENMINYTLAKVTIPESVNKNLPMILEYKNI